MKTSRNKAFTRTDLVTMAAVACMLAMIAAPSLARVTGRTAIAQCAGNLQHYTLALEIYGNENQDLLPADSAGGWPLDASSEVVAILTNNGAAPLTLYCPATAPRFTEADNLNLFNYAPGTYSVLGYAGTLPGTGGLPAAEGYFFQTNANSSLIAPRIPFYAESLPITPSARGLGADATFARDPGTIPPVGPGLQAAELTYDWVNVVGGYSKPQITSHLNGTIPSGGNIGMLDGHVEWHPFTNMIPRAGGAGEPVFFW